MTTTNFPSGQGKKKKSLVMRLTREDEVDLLKKIGCKDAEALELLIIHSAPVIEYQAHAFSKSLPRSSTKDDLLQVGRLAVQKAAATFKAELGYRFNTYLSRIVENAFKSYLKMERKIVGVPDFDDNEENAEKAIAVRTPPPSLQNSILLELGRLSLTEDELIVVGLRTAHDHKYSFREISEKVGHGTARYWSTTYKSALNKFRNLRPWLRKFPSA